MKYLKLFLSMFVVLVVVTGGIYFYKENSKLLKTNNSQDLVTDNIPSAMQKEEMFGEIACLPKKNTGGFQTMECAIGFLSEDGKYYGFKNLSKFDSEYHYSNVGIPLRIEGVIFPKSTPQESGLSNDIYDISGIIEISSIKSK